MCLAGCRKGPPALEDCCLVFELDETNQMDEITRQIGLTPGVQAIKVLVPQISFSQPASLWFLTACLGVCQEHRSYRQVFPSKWRQLVSPDFTFQVFSRGACPFSLISTTKSTRPEIGSFSI